MSTRASTWLGEPSAAVPEPAARAGRRRRGGSREEAIPAQHTARRTIPERATNSSVETTKSADLGKDD
jgi:hypothetical protein